MAHSTVKRDYLFGLGANRLAIVILHSMKFSLAWHERLGMHVNALEKTAIEIIVKLHSTESVVEAAKSKLKAV